MILNAFGYQAPDGKPWHSGTISSMLEHGYDGSSQLAVALVPAGCDLP